MSVEAMAAVLGYTLGKGNGVRKFVLLGLANHADKNGRNAWPSKNTIADYCECDPRTVQRHTQWLLDHGYLREGDQQHVAHVEANKRPIVYDIAMSEQQASEWAAGAPHRNGIRATAATAGKKGGHITAQRRRGDTMSPQHAGRADGDAAISGTGDNLSPQPGGDNPYTVGATTHTAGGDTGVAQTILEPSYEPSSSPRPGRATSSHADGTGGAGTSVQGLGDAIEVLPPAIRQHPSLSIRSLHAAVAECRNRGWRLDQLRARLVGVSSAQHPGAVALVRLRDLATSPPPAPPPARRDWCGSCQPSTRRREDPHDGADRGRCPDCHPSAQQIETTRDRRRSAE